MTGKTEIPMAEILEGPKARKPFNMEEELAAATANFKAKDFKSRPYSPEESRRHGDHDPHGIPTAAPSSLSLAKVTVALADMDETRKNVEQIANELAKLRLQLEGTDHEQFVTVMVMDVHVPFMAKTLIEAKQREYFRALEAMHVSIAAVNTMSEDLIVNTKLPDMRVVSHDPRSTVDKLQSTLESVMRDGGLHAAVDLDERRPRQTMRPVNEPPVRRQRPMPPAPVEAEVVEEDDRSFIGRMFRRNS